MAAPESIPPTTVPGSKTLAGQLNQHDRDWAVRIGLRAAVCVVDLIGIACAGRLITTNFFPDDYFGLANSSAIVMILLGVSFICCASLATVPLLRRRPTHPGISVTVDLILWMLLALSTLWFALVVTRRLQLFGADPTHMYDPSGSYDRFVYGHYYLDAGTNRWLYNTTRTRDYNFVTQEWVKLSPGYRQCSSWFGSCADLDEAINKTWEHKPHILGLAFTVDLVLIVALVAHFELFLWACVETRGLRSQRAARAVVHAVLKRGEVVIINSPSAVPPKPSDIGVSGYSGFSPASKGTVSMPPIHARAPTYA